MYGSELDADHPVSVPAMEVDQANIHIIRLYNNNNNGVFCFRTFQHKWESTASI